MFAHRWQYRHPKVISMKCIWEYSLYQHPPLQRALTERSRSNASTSSERGGGRRQQGSAVGGTRLVCFLHRYQQVGAEPEPLRIKGLINVTAGGGFRNHKLNLQMMIWPSGIHRSPINLRAPLLTPGEGNKNNNNKKEIACHSHFTPNAILKLSATRKKILHQYQGLLQIIYPELLTKNMHQTIIEMQSFV